MESRQESKMIRYLEKIKNTPCYVIEEALLKKNLEILKQVKEQTGCKILLAQKAFSMFSLYPLIGSYLDGATASSLFEAKLGFEEMGKENHIFSPAYVTEEFDQILEYCDHIIFNSFAQLEKFKDKVFQFHKEWGLRINPQHSTQEHGIYDPCAYGSRLGIPIREFKPELLDGISGFHFHTLCEQDSDALEETLAAVEEKFGKYLYQMKWLNIGGGHQITRPGYDIDRLVRCINRIQNQYKLVVYLEPGEAVAFNAGFLVSKVMDIVHNEIDIAILNTSAACHMPDVLEMPYRPYVEGSGRAAEKPYTYRLGGTTCLAGDIVGDYSFDSPLKPEDKLIFWDMAIYSMVKNNTFNGMKLPDISLLKEDGEIKRIRTFGYEDFKERLS